MLANKCEDNRSCFQALKNKIGAKKIIGLAGFHNNETLQFTYSSITVVIACIWKGE